MIVRTILLLFLTTFISVVTASAQQCSPGYFRVGPLEYPVRLADISAQLSGRLCLKIDTSEELALFDSTAFVVMSDAQALAALISREIEKKAKYLDVAIASAMFEDNWGTMQLVIRGTVKPHATSITSEFVARFRANAMISSARVLSLSVERPTFESFGIQGFFVEKIARPIISIAYAQAQSSLRALRFDLSKLIPSYVFLFHPEFGKITLSYAGNNLSVRVPLAGKLTSADATKWVQQSLDGWRTGGANF